MNEVLKLPELLSIFFTKKLIYFFAVLLVCVAGGSGCQIGSKHEFFCRRKATLARMGKSQVVMSW